MIEYLLEFSHTNGVVIYPSPKQPMTAKVLKNDTKSENPSIKSDSSTRSATMIEENGKYSNNILANQTVPNCSAIPVDPNEYSEFVDVEIRDVVIHDFSRLVEEFIKQFESHIGKRLVS